MPIVMRLSPLALFSLLLVLLLSSGCARAGTKYKYVPQEDTDTKADKPTLVCTRPGGKPKGGGPLQVRVRVVLLDAGSIPM